MKIEYARSIPLRKILFKLGFEPISTHEDILHYRSPFSKEKYAYLRVDTKTNTWFDIDMQKGGDVIDLVQQHLECSGVNSSENDCLRWIKNILFAPAKIDLSSFPNYRDHDERYEVRGILPISNYLLLRYLDNRLINRAVANEHVKELRIFDKVDKIVFRAIGVVNEDGGFAIRNRFRKAHTNPSMISFIRGEVDKPDNIQVFKDVFDFMSVLTVQKRKLFEGDSIIINSYCRLNDVMPFIANYGYKSVKTWLPNDNLGELATSRLSAQFENEEGLKHVAMNHVYSPYVSPNEWLISIDKRIG